MFPAATRVRYSSGVNIVFDGGSLAAGVGSTNAVFNLTNQVAALAPISGSGATFVNCAVAGQTTRMMNGLDGGSSADVDAAWLAGKTNILIVWETSNSIASGATGVQATGDLAQYIQARQASRRWIILLVTALPRFDPASTQSQADAANAEITTANRLMRANCRAWGAQAVVDLRVANGPFDQTSFLPGAFAAHPELWSDQYVNLSNAGYSVVAQMIANRLRQIGINNLGAASLSFAGEGLTYAGQQLAYGV